jgi:hypothetical protein
MDLDARLEEYLRIRRSLGYKLERDGKLLAQFIAWLHEQHADTVTVEHAVAWVSLLRRRDRLAAVADVGGARFRRLPAHPRSGGAGATRGAQRSSAANPAGPGRLLKVAAGA